MELTSCVDLFVVWDSERIFGVYDDEDEAESERQAWSNKKGMDGCNDTRVYITHKVLNER